MKRKKKHSKPMHTMQNIAHSIQDNHEIIRDIVLNNDISTMDGPTRIKFYINLCHSLGLNPLTQPFQVIKLQGKETLYATKNATDQLRKINAVSVDKIEQKTVNDIFITTVSGHDKTGRMDGATGAVNIKGLTGDDLANAIMKSETKAKRRFTLSICGLGMLDESELETIPNIEVKNVFINDNGEILAIEETRQDKSESADLAAFVIHACSWIGSAQNSKSLSTRLVTTENDYRWGLLNENQKKEIRDMYNLREKELGVS